MASEWTLEDAPELLRHRARQDAAWAVECLMIGFRVMCAGLPTQGRTYFKRANCHAEDAARNATRYRDAKRAVSELRNTFFDFEHFCRDLCGKDPVYHTMEHVAQDHEDMLSEIDWEDDNDVCF